MHNKKDIFNILATPSLTETINPSPTWRNRSMPSCGMFQAESSLRQKSESSECKLVL